MGTTWLITASWGADVPAFDEAFSRSFGLGLSAIQQAQQQKEREEERDWLREQRAQIRSQKAKEDRAWNEYEQVSSRGLSTTGAGLATPDSVGSVVANGYGATVGDAAAKEMAGDYARELGRFAASAPAGLDTSRINAAAAQAAAASQDGPQFRKATGLDINRAKQGVARARRDMGMLDSLETQEAKLGAYERGADVIKDEKALQSYLQRLNLNGDMPLTVADHLNDKGAKTGYKMLHLVDDAGNVAPLKMSMGQIKAAVTGYELMQDPRTFAEGYAMLKDSSKELADRVAAANQRAQAVVTTNNQAAQHANADARGERQLDITKGYYDAQTNLGWARLGEDKAARAAREAADRNQILHPGMAYRMVDGKLVPVMTGLRVGQKSGVYEAVEAPMPGGAGLIPSSVLDPTRYMRDAESMVGTPIPGRLVNGKQQVHTMETAVEALMNAAIARYAGAQQQGLNQSAIDATRAALGGNAGKTTGLRFSAIN